MVPAPIPSSCPRNVRRCHGTNDSLRVLPCASPLLLFVLLSPSQPRCAEGRGLRVVVDGGDQGGRGHRGRGHRGSRYGAVPAAARRGRHRAGAGPVPARGRHVADAVQERLARAGLHRRRRRAPGQVPPRPGDEDAVVGGRAGHARVLLRGRSSWAGGAGGGEAGAPRDAGVQAPAGRHLLLVQAQVDRRARARGHAAGARGREAATLEGGGGLRRRELADRGVDGVLRATVRRAHGLPWPRGLRRRRRAAVRAQGELHLRAGPPRRVRAGLPDQGLLVHLLQSPNPRAEEHGRGGAEEGGAGAGAWLAGRPGRRDAEHARRRRGEDAARGPVAVAGGGAPGVEGRRGARGRRVAPNDAQPRPGRVLRAGGRRRAGAPPRARGARGGRRRRGAARVREGEVGAGVPADGARGAGGRAGAVGQPGGVRGAGRRGHPEAGQAGALPRAHQLRVWPARAAGAVAMIDTWV